MTPCRKTRRNYPDSENAHLSAAAGAAKTIVSMRLNVHSDDIERFPNQDREWEFFYRVAYVLLFFHADFLYLIIPKLYFQDSDV